MHFQVGQYHEIPEDDYLIGVGVLRIEIVELLGYETHHGAQWRKVRGVEYGWNGEPVDGDREVLLRVPTAKRSPNGKVTRTKLI